MKRFWPLILIAAGVFLLVGGFMYDLIFAGIPYQDPPPELAALYNRHARIASTTCWIGAGAFLVGSVAGILRLVARGRGANDQ